MFVPQVDPNLVQQALIVQHQASQRPDRAHRAHFSQLQVRQAANFARQELSASTLVSLLLTSASLASPVSTKAAPHPHSHAQLAPTALEPSQPTLPARRCSVAVSLASVA
jgi:hypothetical protein